MGLLDFLLVAAIGYWACYSLTQIEGRLEDIRSALEALMDEEEQ